jgi:hypothetical protein
VVDRTATRRSLPVDPQSKQVSWLRRFGVLDWETLIRDEASDILDCRLAEREEEREQRLTSPHASRQGTPTLIRELSCFMGDWPAPLHWWVLFHAPPAGVPFTSAPGEVRSLTVPSSHE